MEHWHIAMMRVTRDDADGRYFATRQVDVDYPSAEAAGEVFEDLLKAEFPSFTSELRTKSLWVCNDDGRVAVTKWQTVRSFPFPDFSILQPPFGPEPLRCPQANTRPSPGQ